MHLDINVDDPDAAGTAERLGDIRLPDQGGPCPVYADPAGHPFCLCSPGL
jgi:Glyoxalase-like domain